jgi:hypothetical protein
LERRAPVLRRKYPLIERRADLGRAAFAREHLSPNRPVVVPTGDTAWCARWSPSAICARFGDHPIDVEPTEVVYVGERALQTTTIASLVGAALDGDAARRWKGLEFLSRVPGMRDDLEARPPPFEALVPGSTVERRTTLWIAPRGTMSSLHHDGDFDTLNLQVSGKKLFLLVPPPQRSELHAYGSAESPVNPFVPDLARFPRFSGASPVEATLEPGDLLLVPKYWWHCVYAVEPSVNLSIQIRWEGEPSPWRVLEGAPLVHRSLTLASAELKRRGLRRFADATRLLWLAAYERLVPRVEPQERCELANP